MTDDPNITPPGHLMSENMRRKEAAADRLLRARLDEGAERSVGVPLHGMSFRMKQALAKLKMAHERGGDVETARREFEQIARFEEGDVAANDQAAVDRMTALSGDELMRRAGG